MVGSVNHVTVADAADKIMHGSGWGLGTLLGTRLVIWAAVNSVLVIRLIKLKQTSRDRYHAAQTYSMCRLHRLFVETAEASLKQDENEMADIKKKHKGWFDSICPWLGTALGQSSARQLDKQPFKEFKKTKNEVKWSPPTYGHVYAHSFFVFHDFNSHCKSCSHSYG